MKRNALWALAALLLAPLAVHGEDASESPGDAQSARCETVIRAQLARPYPPSGCWHYEDFALAAYWLNERTAEADKAILSEREEAFAGALKDGGFHWHAYILERTSAVASSRFKRETDSFGSTSTATHEVSGGEGKRMSIVKVARAAGVSYARSTTGAAEPKDMVPWTPRPFAVSVD